MLRASTLMLAAILCGCGLLGASTADCGWPSVRLAYRGHTTLADAGLAGHADFPADEPGELLVTADPVPLPQAAPDFSAAPTDPPKARMYCFHPDGSNRWLRGVLPGDWRPPDG